MRIVPRNWREFQHYTNRNPPWIRLHRKLLDNKDFHRLPTASKALAPMLWLLASESVDGVIKADTDDLAFRLRISEKDAALALRPLIENGFFDVVQDDSGVLAEGQQAAPKNVPEALQRQSITETEADGARKRALPTQSKKKTQYPEGFTVSARVQAWAADKGFDRLMEHLEAFERKAKAKGYTYLDWDLAFMEAIREDWAKLRGRGTNGAAPPPEHDNKGTQEAQKTAQYLRDNELTPEQRAASAERAKQVRLIASASIKRVA